MTNEDIQQIDVNTLLKILDHSSDEIYVFDKNRRIIYVNKMCERHYGVTPNELIGKSNDELLAKGYWSPSIIPAIFKEKKIMTLKQTTYLGIELITTAIPILNQDDEVEMVVCTARKLDYKEIELTKSTENTKEQSFSSDLITNSPKMREIIRFCKKIASVDVTVLIQGESGTGKGVIANLIHKNSKRKNAPFVSINCAAIPENLLEAELFGYAEGAFTGADKKGKKGLLEVANNGTIFLDEIGEMSPKIQAKLLHVIQERQFFPVGGRELKKVDIRIIAATNQPLQKLVEKREFREDLFYRLNVIEIQLPPLRERKEDLLPLTYYFLNKFNAKYGLNRLLSQEAVDIIQRYSWPGNVRQLENVIERLVVIGDDIIKPVHLPAAIMNEVQDSVIDDYPGSLDAAIEALKKHLITQSYQKHKSTRKVAKDLSISQPRVNDEGVPAHRAGSIVR